MTADTAESRWYWCLEHNRPEPEETMCRAAGRLGPYASAEEARAWKDRSETRNETWDAEDEKWDAWPKSEEPPQT